MQIFLATPIWETRGSTWSCLFSEYGSSILLKILFFLKKNISHQNRLNFNSRFHQVYVCLFFSGLIFSFITLILLVIKLIDRKNQLLLEVMCQTAIHVGIITIQVRSQSSKAPKLTLTPLASYQVEQQHHFVQMNTGTEESIFCCLYLTTLRQATVSNHIPQGLNSTVVGYNNRTLKVCQSFPLSILKP